MFILEVTVLKFGDLLGEWMLATNVKFQYNISKNTPARQKTQGMGCEYHHSSIKVKKCQPSIKSVALFPVFQCIY